jgi:hypothetical protein
VARQGLVREGRVVLLAAILAVVTCLALRCSNRNSPCLRSGGVAVRSRRLLQKERKKNLLSYRVLYI